MRSSRTEWRCLPATKLGVEVENRLADGHQGRPLWVTLAYYVAGHVLVLVGLMSVADPFGGRGGPLHIF